MPATDSFTSSAAAVASGTAVLTAAAVLVSTALAVASTTAVFTTGVMMSDVPGAAHVDYTEKGFRIAVYANRVQITKAATLGGSQSALSLPLALDDARDLAVALKNAVV